MGPISQANRGRELAELWVPPIGGRLKWRRKRGRIIRDSARKSAYSEDDTLCRTDWFAIWLRDLALGPPTQVRSHQMGNCVTDARNA